jgi:hypothetical protein
LGLRTPPRSPPVDPEGRAIGSVRSTGDRGRRASGTSGCFILRPVSTAGQALLLGRRIQFSFCRIPLSDPFRSVVPVSTDLYALLTALCRKHCRRSISVAEDGRIPLGIHDISGGSSHRPRPWSWMGPKEIFLLSPLPPIDLISFDIFSMEPNPSPPIPHLRTC